MQPQQKHKFSGRLPSRDPDPYPNYSWLRERAPVSMMFSPHGNGNSWFVTSYELAHAMLANPLLSNDNRNSSDWTDADAAEDNDSVRGLLAVDRPEHTRLRKLVHGAFTPNSIRRWHPAIVQICQRAVDRIARDGAADLVSAFAIPVPVQVIHEVLGIPQDQCEDPAHCFDLFYRSGLARPPDAAAEQELLGYLDHLIAYKREHRGDDVTSLLLTHLERGDLRDEDELRSMMYGILGAGHVTTVQFFGSAAFRLLTHPDQRMALDDGRASWAEGVDEMLRIDAPIQATVYRYAMADLEIGGVRIAKGDAVLISLGAANRDPGRFERPDEFQIGRDSSAHLAFGRGVHVCLGMHLARLEAEIGLHILFRQLSDMRLAIPAEEVVWAYGPMLRGPRELPVVFQAA